MLSPEETRYNERYVNEKYGPYDPCGRCLSQIDEAFEDVLEETEIDWLLENDDEFEEPFEEETFVR